MHLVILGADVDKIENVMQWLVFAIFLQRVKMFKQVWMRKSGREVSSSCILLFSNISTWMN